MGFWKVFEPIATTIRAEASPPTSQPYRAIYHGHFQLDPVRVLLRLLVQFLPPNLRVIRGFLQGVRGVRSAQCAHTTHPDHPVKFSNGSDCLYWPLIYGYL